MFEKFYDVIVAEDENINFLYINELLKELPLNILHAKNGLEVIDIFKTKNSIALILLDIKMPYMNGYQVVEEIRKTNSEIPIIAQTAYALTEDRNRILEMGFTDYISKPFNHTDFKELIKKYIKI